MTAPHALARFAGAQARELGRIWRAAGSGPASRWRGLRAHAPALARWTRRAFAGPPVALELEQRCTVVLLSYRRPANLDPLLRSVLRCDFVDQVIVSNNNPDVRLARWLSVRDDRIALIEQPHRTRQGIRLELAYESRAPYVLSIDDDLFLTPEQLALLFWELVDDPTVPHGIGGEVASARLPGLRTPPGYPFVVDVLRAEREVDHLTRAYAFTHAHAAEALRLFAELRMGPPSAIGNGEDLVLSFAGRGAPRIHDTGPLLQCLSSGTPGIATWATHPRFFAERLELHRALARVRGHAELLA